MSKNDFAGAVTKQLASLRDGNVYSIAKVQKEAGLIKIAAAKLDVRYHACAVAALGCVMDHNQATPLADLLNSMGKSARAKALAEWAERFSHVVLEKHKEKGWSARLVDKADRWTQEQLQDAMVKAEAEPFWTPEEKSSRDFSLHMALAALLKKAEAAKGKGSIEDERELAALAKLTALADDLNKSLAANDTATGDALEKVG